MSEETQRQYEITIILSPELREAELSSFEEGIKLSLDRLGGSLKKKGALEKRNLAYPIKKFQSGYYLSINFLLNPEKLEELNSLLKHNKEVLRHIVVLAPEEETRAITRKKTEPKVEKLKEKPKDKMEKKGKIQLEEIDKKLEEILGM